MGDNSYGELGDGTANNLKIRSRRTVPSNVIAIAAGQGHSLFIKSDSSLWGMGDNGSGELGDLRFGYIVIPTRVVPISPIANGGFEQATSRPGPKPEI